MFKDYLAKLKAIKDAFLNGEISQGLRLWSALQNTVADLYDMLVGNKLPTFASPEDEADLQKCIEECEDCKTIVEAHKPKLEKAAAGVSPFEIIGLVKMGLDFAKMIFEAWKNRKNPAPTN